MSILVLRGHPARSARYASVCSSCLEHFQPFQRNDGPVALAVSRQGRRAFVDWKNVEHPEWRKEAVRRINARTPDDLPRESYVPDPRTKDGFLTKEFYSIKPSFPDISTDLSPVVDQDQIPEERRTLECTRPAPLEAVEQKQDEAIYKYYYRIGRSYLRFYKTGFKNIRANWKEFSEIKSWLDPFTIGASARFGGTTHYNKKKEMVPIPHITRRDYVLYHRLKHDLFKLIPFGVIFLVCGEFTPIAILVLGNRVTPYTCRIPKQQRQTIDSALERFRTFQREMRKLTRHSVPTPKHTFDYQPPTRRREHPWRRDALFGHLVGQTNFSSLPFPLTAGLYWHSILQPRLTGYWDKIFCDTLLIKREGGFSSLSPQDIYEYALNYGSLSLLVIMQYEVIHRKNYDFVSQELKDRLVPILDTEADVMLDEDFKRLHPSMHWARAYRDSTRWGMHTPDVKAALELMQEYGMEWSTDRESWGGNWKVRDAPTSKSQLEQPQTQPSEKPELATTQVERVMTEPAAISQVEIDTPPVPSPPHPRHQTTAKGAMQAQLEQQAHLKDEAMTRQERRREKKLPV